jgi:hypothetical protein
MIMRFVPHSNVKAYEALGWEDRGFSPGHHGVHSRVMKWEGEGEPIEPNQSESERKPDP